MTYGRIPPSHLMPEGDDPSDWTEYAMTQSVADRVFATPGFLRPLGDPRLPLCRRGESHIPGKGLFAIMSCNPGTAIITERPLLLFPWLTLAGVSTGPESNLTEKERRIAVMDHFEERLGRMVGRMTPENQREYKSLPTFERYSDEGCRLLANIMNTNALDVLPLRDPTMQGRSGRYRAICKTICRVNHRYVSKSFTRE